MRETKHFVLFDFDGVIADSFDIALSIAQRKCAHVTPEEYRRGFEGNINDWETHLLTLKHGPECQHDLPWFEHFIPAFEERVRAFPGIAEVIGSLHKKYILIIISSTLTSPIQGFMEKYHLGRYFSEIMGNDVHTHKTEKIKMVFGKYKTSAAQCLLITDSLGDMNEANSVAVDTIGVTWGWHTRETLSRGDPYRIVERVQDIEPAVSDYFTNVQK